MTMVIARITERISRAPNYSPKFNADHKASVVRLQFPENGSRIKLDNDQEGHTVSECGDHHH